MPPSGENILVTGGAGYIGSHTCKLLAREGYTPIVVDNLSRGHRSFAKFGPFELVDVRDEQGLSKVMRKYRPQAVIHFAALAYVGESMEDPSSYYDVNVNGTLVLLRTMLKSNVDRIVFSSTCATYGEPTSLPIVETHSQNPINPYGATKLAVERILADFEMAYGVRHAALRYFNAAGADPDSELGEAHDPETHLLPSAILAALGLRAELKVFGSDYDTPDGTAIRDYVNVIDLAAAHVLALKRLLNDGKSLQVNLGTGRGSTVLEVIRMVERETERDVPISWSPGRPGDPAILVADSQLARELLGWTPLHSSLDEIVGSAVRWHSRFQSR